MIRFSLTSLFPDFKEFHSSNLDKEELESIIKDAIGREDPNANIKNLEYTEDGILITLDDDNQIEIEIDWQEIILD